jgi:hypothetical protein
MIASNPAAIGRALLEMATMGRLVSWEVKSEPYVTTATLRLNLSDDDLAALRRAAKEDPTEDTESGIK